MLTVNKELIFVPYKMMFPKQTDKGKRVVNEKNNKRYCNKSNAGW